MRKIVRVAIVLVSAGTFLVVARPSSAVNLPAYTWTVPCNDGSGVPSNATLDVELPNGTYVVTAVGDCMRDTNESVPTTASTPCSVPMVGPVPCTTHTVHNVPSSLCWNTVAFVATVELCGEPGVHPAEGGCLYGVMMSADDFSNAHCLEFGAAGTFEHRGGVMRDRFVEADSSDYADNGGAFAVTAVFTPLSVPI
ncbi:MAG TPA: hypothetical protein VG795_06450 [Acidimicrobiia bacterium]|nr:hypothetical protein [Acidimicrobiia bacterium]